jgi:nucleotide-binding universal stress UspA family protein
VLVLAYDGTLNGDWVAHYAVRFAANTPERALRLVHVQDGAAPEALDEAIARIASECRVHGVALETALVPRAGRDVAGALLDEVPRGATVVSGLRARPRQRAFLAGTASARLLREGRFSVIAIRVVHPGVLGQPGRVLLPFAGRPRQAALALPLLRLLGRDLHHLHLLHVREVSRLRLRLMSPDRVERLLAEGRAALAPIEEELRAALAPLRFGLDASVAVSDSTRAEILVCAGRLRSRLIGLGASRRSLWERTLYGAPIEQLLQDAPADVAVYRTVE